MNGCVHRNQFNFCSYYSHDDVISFCDIENCEEIKPSNGDKIRAMTDEELGKFLGSIVQSNTLPIAVIGERTCIFDWFNWLEQEAEHE